MDRLGKKPSGVTLRTGLDQIAFEALAVGLNAGRMTAFDPAKVEQQFLPEGKVQANVLINIGYGDDSSCSRAARTPVRAAFYSHTGRPSTPTLVDPAAPFPCRPPEARMMLSIRGNWSGT